MYKILGADGKEYGPVDLDALKQWVTQGRANAQTRVQLSGTAEWKPAVEIPELSVLFAAPSAPSPTTPPPLRSLAPETGQRKGLAVTSFVLGLLSMLCFGVVAGIPAIICGHMASSRAKREPAQYGGAGFAVAGLILGYLSLVLTVIVAIIFFSVFAHGNMGPQFAPQFGGPQFNPMRPANRQQIVQDTTPSGRCANNLRQIGLAFKIWAIDNGDQFPFNVSTNRGGTLELCERGADGFDKNVVAHFQVISNDLGSIEILVCPEDKSKHSATDFSHLQPDNISYRLRSGPNLGDASPQETLATCPIHGHILRCDGSVQK